MLCLALTWYEGGLPWRRGDGDGDVDARLALALARLLHIPLVVRVLGSITHPLGARRRMLWDTHHRVAFHIHVSGPYKHTRDSGEYIKEISPERPSIVYREYSTPESGDTIRGAAESKSQSKTGTIRFRIFNKNNPLDSL